MQLKPGDRVKFLNATGGGIVTKTLSSRMVLVADLDGFEVPALISELVKIDSPDAGARYFEDEFRAPSAIRQKQGDQGIQGTREETGGKGPQAMKTGSEPEINDQTGETDGELLNPGIIRNRASEDIFFAFVPHDQKWLVTGMIDIFLINNTSFDIIYNLFHHENHGSYKGVDYGSLFANTRQLLATVTRETLSQWMEGSIQFLFHKEQTEVVVPPFNSDFRIDGAKFHHEGAYKDSPLIDEKGIVVKVVPLTRYMRESRPDSGENRDSTSDPSSSAVRENRHVIFSHQSEPRKAVVDLHIHELVEDPSNLQKNEILEFQKEYFIRCLDGAMANNFLNIVFIHGVGNGILRDVLTGHLKKTEGIEWFDAPMALYGVGAIEVRIPHNL